MRLAGFGGQGIVLAGSILGKAAALHQGLNAVFTQSYGPEARGGACSADIVLSTGPIYYPKVSAPQILVLMSEDARRMVAYWNIGWILQKRNEWDEAMARRVFATDRAES